MIKGKLIKSQAKVPFFKKIAKGMKVDTSAICSGGRKKEVVQVRKLFIQVTIRKMGHTGVEVARFLGITTSAVNCPAGQEELSEIRRYVKS